MPAVSTSNKLCRAAHVDLPPALARVQLLSDAGIIAATIPANKIAERCAALPWARDSIAKDEDPDSWPTMLPISLMTVLMSLYALYEELAAANLAQRSAPYSSSHPPPPLSLASCVPRPHSQGTCTNLSPPPPSPASCVTQAPQPGDLHHELRRKRPTKAGPDLARY
jgi:hypothetical protein